MKAFKKQLFWWKTQTFFFLNGSEHVFLLSYTPLHFSSSAFAAATRRPPLDLLGLQRPRLPGGHTLTQLESAAISDALWSSRPSAPRSHCKASVSHVHFLVCGYQQGWRIGGREDISSSVTFARQNVISGLTLVHILKWTRVYWL